MGVLVEEELQEPGVVVDIVKQPSSAVLVENRMNVGSTPIENIQRLFSSECACVIH